MVRQPAINAQNRTPLSIERIIESALQIVDGQGLSRLTMRRLGDALEVEAMAIYHHLPRGKEQLLDGLVAHVAIAPADTRGAAGWREALRDWARGYRVRLLDHAGVLPLIVTRRNPAALATTTASLQEAMRLGGISEAAAGIAAHTLLGYVIGHAALEVRGVPEGSGETVDWDARFNGGLTLILNAVNP